MGIPEGALIQKALFIVKADNFSKVQKPYK